MKKLHRLLLALTASLCLTTPVRAQITAFSYSGQLEDRGVPANGNYVFRFTLFDSPSGSSPVAGPLAEITKTLVNGDFTVVLDFGDSFNGSDRWLQIEVRPIAVPAFTTLFGRDQILSTPYAITAKNLTGNVTASQITGTFNTASLADGAVTSQKLAGGSPSSGQVLSYDGLGLVWATPAGDSSAWGFAGNNPASGSFLGTALATSTPLELRSKGQRVMLFDYNDVSPNIIGGYSGNSAVAGLFGVNIAGGGVPGGENRVSGNFGSIGGGAANSIGVGADGAAIAGGALNTNSGPVSFIGGGVLNWIKPTLWGGATIGGGDSNTIENNANDAVIGGGAGNIIQVNATNAVVVGGSSNVNAASYGSLGGGRFNHIGSGANGAAIAGGVENTNSGPFAFIGGGIQNWIQPSVQGGAMIGGGQANLVGSAADGAAILGGALNTNSGPYSFIGGGTLNWIQATLWGGATIGGGDSNRIELNADDAVIGGGAGNTILANATNAVIVGGGDNANSGPYGFLGGGGSNNIGSAGRFGTIPGGFNNTVAGSVSFAAGKQAKAVNNNTFVWSDGNNDTDFTSSAANQFLVHAGGGVGINLNHPSEALDVNGKVKATAFIGDGSGLINVGSSVTLSGEVTGLATANSVASVGGQSAANVASGVFAANAASVSEPGTIVKRDNSGSFSAGTITAANFVGNGSGLTGISGSGWGFAGNTIVSGNFLGTINNLPLELRAKGLTALRIAPGGNTGTSIANLIGGAADNSVAAGAYGAVIAGGGGMNGSGYPNTADSSLVFIGSGQSNWIHSGADFSSIVGGRFNSITSFGSVIGGGSYNGIGNSESAIAGGANNRVDGNTSFIGAGNGNYVGGAASAVVGGEQNTNLSSYSFIGGGSKNSMGIFAYYSTIPGGYQNRIGANCQYSFAAGTGAAAAHSSTFVWNDGGVPIFGSTANNQFLIGATNGVGINTNHPHSALEVNGDVIAKHFYGDGTGLTGVGGAVADGSITAPKFAASLPASGQVLSYNGSGLLWTTPADTGWSLTGNTLAGGNFLGSINNKAVELRANSLAAFRLQPGGVAGTSTANLIGGDANNSIAADVFGSVIGGGSQNTILCVNGVIAGGAFNSIEGTASSSSILGGVLNRIFNGSDLSLIGGGQQNSIRDSAGKSFIGAGQANVISTNSDHSVIAGGYGNQISEAARESSIGGGRSNLIESADANAGTYGIGGAGSIIGGGLDNKIRNGAFLSYIGSGSQNEIGTNSYDSVIGGGQNNKVWRQSVVSVIAGGLQNAIESFAYDSSIGGGSANKIRQSGRVSVIAGGSDNEIGTNSYNSAIGGGFNNHTDGTNTTIGGGSLNQAVGGNATIGGGYLNQAVGDHATVSGGSQNTAAGTGAVVLGGQQNYATNDFSVAVGQGAVSRATNSFALGAMIATPGDAQAGHYVLREDVPGTAPRFIEGPEVPISGTIVFTALVVAKQLSDGAVSAWEYKGSLGRTPGPAMAWTDRVVIRGGIDFSGSLPLPPPYFPGPVARNNRLSFLVEGVRGDTVRWVISIQTVEVIY